MNSDTISILETDKRRPELVRARLADLIPVPDQDLIYDPCTSAEDRAFLEDIRRRHLERPIEVFPAVNGKYEILDGNRRKQALGSLGFLEVDVLIRWDLEHASPEERQIAFISANFQRRQLDQIQKVRAAIRRYELLRNKGRRLSTIQLQKVRDELGGMIGVSGRTISRYLRLTRAPLPIQRAVSRGLLPLVVGEQVADLRPNQQSEIADQVLHSENANQIRAVMRQHGLIRDARHKKPSDALANFVRTLEIGLHDLDGRLDQVKAAHTRPHTATLRKSSETIARLLEISGS